MTPPRIRGILTLLLIGCLTVPWGQAQMPGHAPAPYGSSSSANASKPPLHATQKREFAIPFSVDTRVARPVEVHLYVSVDEGNKWQLHSRQPPNARHFGFRATGDGEYWFASRTLDGARQSQPSASLPPELRVIVDTEAPQIELNARAGEAGHVLASWRIFDPNLLASSLRLEYQEDAGEPWNPVAVQLPEAGGDRTRYQGQVQWKPETGSSTLNVRAEVKDRAGNLGVANRRVLLPAPSPASSLEGSGRNGLPSDPFVRHRQPSEGAVPWASGDQAGRIASGDRGVRTPASDRTVASDRTRHPGGSSAPEWSRTPPASNTANHATSTQESMSRGTPNGSEAQAQYPAPTEGDFNSPFEPELHTPMKQAAAQFPSPPGLAASEATDSASKPGPEFEHNEAGGGEMSSRQPPGSAEFEHNEAEGGEMSSRQPPGSAGGGGARRVITPAGNLLDAPEDVAERLPAGERPRMTNSRRFQLEYDVAATGASGVAEVQLWATADAGRAWRLWGTDDDRQSPFDVSLERDGIFGFHVVVVGDNGMAGRRPRSGDPADIWIGVDTTAPTAELTGATYGEGPRAGKLLIQWQASDSFLAARPITLYYSPAADGPWTTIVSSVPNTGEFAWSAGPKLPPEVYLKLEVRDQAGNTATARTDQPVSIAELAPKARIRGVQPLRDMDREAFRIPRRR